MTCKVVLISIKAELCQVSTAPAGPLRAPRGRAKQKTPLKEEEGEAQQSSVGTTSDDEDEPNAQDSINDIIQCLSAPDAPTAVSERYNNEAQDLENGGRNIFAFARLCGRDWTYYINSKSVLFGREQGPYESQSMDGKGKSQMYEVPDVDIDLGPSKIVSRAHAELRYNEEEEQWHITVNGRNGIKVNDSVVKRGETRLVSNGTVISIANTEMLFQNPIGEPEIHQTYLDRAAPPTEREILPVHSPMRPTRHQTFSDNHVYASALNDIRQIVHASHSSKVPVTPDRISPPKAKTPGSGKKKSNSPAAGSRSRAIMMESTEQIDYSLDENKHLKPQCNYASMITWAILSSERECVSLANIYSWIQSHYAFYRHNTAAWQNSVRHNLSLSRSFEKTPRRADEPGKGMLWRLQPENREEAIASANKQAGKGGGRISSAPGSPAGLPTGFVLPAKNTNINVSPVARTPPASYPGSSLFRSRTPTRASTAEVPAAYAYAYAPTQGPAPVFSDNASPMPIRGRNGHLHAADSSPTLTSSVWNTEVGMMQTPAPRAHNLEPPKPNTIRLPTSHMPSSPASYFYKYYGDTPNRTIPESSPLKVDSTGTAPVPQSSSPPAAMNGVDSPSKASKGRQPQYYLSPSVMDHPAGVLDDDADEPPIDIARYVEHCRKICEKLVKR